MFLLQRMAWTLGQRGGWRRVNHLAHHFSVKQEEASTSLRTGLIVGLYEEEEGIDLRLTTKGEAFDNKLNGKLMSMIKAAKLDGRIGKSKVFNGFHEQYESVAVVGLGKDGAGYNLVEGIDQGMENVRIAAGKAALELREVGCNNIFVDPMEYAEQAAEGCSLALWRFQENLMAHKWIETPKLELFESDDVEGWQRGLCKANAQNFVRTMCDSPANQVTPSNFAQAAVDACCPCGVNVDVRQVEWIQNQNMTSFIAVAQSSCEPPVFLELNYCGDQRDEKPILLVGSGLTFNTGGLCIKPTGSMAEYRGAMAGAACVVATMRAIAELGLPINVAAVVPLCENMPSGMSFRPGDIITTLNGKFISVDDTNNAGRLILADTMTYAQEVYKPSIVIDVATLTKEIQSAMGGSAAGVFSNSEFLWLQLNKAGSLTGDRVWRFPLWDYFRTKVSSYDHVDLSNQGEGSGGQCCLGAAFLQEFIKCVDWVHLDISGVGMLNKGQGYPYLEENRMTGRPTRTLIQFLYQLSCPAEQEQMKEKCQ